MILKTFNKLYASKHNLELIKGEGYFYWWATTEEMRLELASLREVGVYVYRFSHLSDERWIEELKMILDKIKSQR